MTVNHRVFEIFNYVNMFCNSWGKQDANYIGQKIDYKYWLFDTGTSVQFSKNKA